MPGEIRFCAIAHQLCSFHEGRLPCVKIYPLGFRYIDTPETIGFCGLAGYLFTAMFQQITSEGISTHMQQRSFYRVSVPHGAAGFCALIVQDGKKVNLAIQNISLGGVCLYGSDPLIDTFQANQTIEDAVFSLGEYLEFEADIFIVAKSMQKMQRGLMDSDVMKLHARFDNLSPAKSVELQRTIYQMEMIAQHPGAAAVPRIIVIKR